LNKTYVEVEVEVEVEVSVEVKEDLKVQVNTTLYEKRKSLMMNTQESSIIESYSTYAKI
jgi:hypothetical protein